MPSSSICHAGPILCLSVAEVEHRLASFLICQPAQLSHAKVALTASCFCSQAFLIVLDTSAQRTVKMKCSPLAMMSVHISFQPLVIHVLQARHCPWPVILSNSSLSKASRALVAVVCLVAWHINRQVRHINRQVERLSMCSKSTAVT